MVAGRQSPVAVAHRSALGARRSAIGDRRCMGICENCPIVCLIKKCVPKRINRCCKIRVGWVGGVGTRAPFSFYLRRVLLFDRGATRRRVSKCNSIVSPELISFSFLFPGRDVSTLNVLIIESLDSRTTSGPTIACRRFLAHFVRVLKDLPIHDLFRSCALRARL